MHTGAPRKGTFRKVAGRQHRCSRGRDPWHASASARLGQRRASEIFQYNHQEQRPATAANRLGLGHIAFVVDDVWAARERVIAAGGGVVGDVVTTEISGAGTITFAYVTDPEGNIIELQSWSRGEKTSRQGVHNC